MEAVLWSGSALTWFPWIQNQIRNKEVVQNLQKKINLFSNHSKMLLYLRRYVFWPLYTVPVLYVFHVKIQHLVTAKSVQDPYPDQHGFALILSQIPDPQRGKKRYTNPDPTPPWNHYRSTTLNGCKPVKIIGDSATSYRLMPTDFDLAPFFINNYFLILFQYS